MIETAVGREERRKRGVGESSVGTLEEERVMTWL